MSPNGGWKGGCAGPLGRIWRGTAYGSKRRLQQLKAYRDTPVPLPPGPHVQPIARDRRAERSLRADGVAITASEIATLRAIVGHECQVCRRPDIKDVPHGRWPIGVDHDHHEKRLRGFLCQACNSAMQFLDLGVDGDRDRRFNNAMWLFAEASGVKGDPWYRTPPWFNA